MKEKRFLDIFSQLSFSISISWLLVIVTLVTFGIAIGTPPLSGCFCTGDCFEYPYLDILERFLRDYYWMYPAMLLMIVYVTFMGSIHHFADQGKQVFSRTAFALAIISAAIIIPNYFLQLTVVQASLANAETEGIPILTQYNPHGIFIALEEIGYIIMSLSLLFLLPVFDYGNKVGKTLRWILFLGFLFNLAGFIYITSQYGNNRGYRYEVVVISINWLLLILTGLLSGRWIKEKLSI